MLIHNERNYLKTKESHIRRLPACHLSAETNTDNYY